MMNLLRRYQRALYIVITVVIVVSFSFFGTFGTFDSKKGADPVIFTAVDGKKIHRSQFQEFVTFISSDSKDKLLYGGSQGLNFFNDGVVTKDFLETGLSEIIVRSYLNDLKGDLQSRLEKEKRFIPYTHPSAKFLGAERVWAYFAPNIKSNLESLKSEADGASEEAFNLRVKLYLAERQFPSAYLRQILKYQESQYEWIQSDSSLQQSDLSLFGYHTLHDWFGQKFLDLIAQFIINSAKIAESKGLIVSMDEALSSMMRNAQASFKENQSNPAIGMMSFSNYVNEQLRRMGLDQSKAVEIWRQILMCRRLIQEAANPIIVDGVCYTDFYHYLNESVDADVYQLPQELRFANQRDLQKFQLYLMAVSPSPSEKAVSIDTLDLPMQDPSIEQIKKVYPELIEKQFKIQFSSIDAELLKSKISVRNTWDWQVADDHWVELVKKFNQLGRAPANSREERFAVLDSLDANSRMEIDNYSRSRIIQENPQWIEDALHQSSLQDSTFGLRLKGGNLPFEGLDDRQALLKKLEAASLNEQSEDLKYYSQNGRHFYRIIVVERNAIDELLPYKTVAKDGTLDKILDDTLKAAYPSIRSAKPSLYITENGEWKSFDQVKDLVADAYFHKLYAKLDEILDKESQFIDQKNQNSISQARCQVRLLPYVKSVEQKIMKDPSVEGQFCRKSENLELNTQESVKLSNQWRLIKDRIKVLRGQESSPIALETAFSLNVDQWSSVQPSFNGNITFFKIVEKGTALADAQIRSKIEGTRNLLVIEAIRVLGQDLLVEMQNKQAISLHQDMEEKVKA